MTNEAVRANQVVSTRVDKNFGLLFSSCSHSAETVQQHLEFVQIGSVKNLLFIICN